jgi:ppGpp synthetase/RelA/SpoT-type nucleotidyltranferase
MGERSVEDRLREEYFDLLPDIRRVVENLAAEVMHCVLPIRLELDKYERLEVISRIKECDSALDALRRRQEGATFDRDRPELYTLTDLNDLAGVRVLAFPRKRLAEIDRQLCKRFPDWTADPVAGADDVDDEPLAFKYHGFCEASTNVRGEFQIVSMLIGFFWQVEHSAIYKPTPQLKGVVRSLEMRERTQEVYKALRTFEEEFERQIRSV